jgi:hypothetical protein
MKTLSIKTPYAYLIAYGVKTIENRTWKTKYRGKILIHASGIDIEDIFDDYLPKEILEEYQKYWNAIDNNQKYELQLKDSKKMAELDKISEKIIKEKKIFYKSGLIIGEVEIIDIQKNYDSIWAEKNCYNWILINPIIFNKPIPIKGKLGLWDYNL